MNNPNVDDNTTDHILTHNTTNISGCDSVIIINLTIHDSHPYDTAVTSCDSYTWDGIRYDSSGTYTNPDTTIWGCDSSRTLILIINDSTSSDTSITYCDSLLWNGEYRTETAEYTVYGFENSSGCDSSATLDLTIINSSDTTIIDEIACDSYVWTQADLSIEQLDSSASYIRAFTNIAGCDSIVRLNLIVNTSDTTIIDTSACVSFSFEGGIYSISETLTFIYKNIDNCDSIVILNLTINQSYSDTVIVSNCNTYIWDVDDEAYSFSGTYTNLNTSIFGCDSIIVLQLTIYSDSALNDVITDCDSYYWDVMINKTHLNGYLRLIKSKCIDLHIKFNN